MQCWRTWIVMVLLLGVAGVSAAQAPAAPETWCRNVGHAPQQPKAGERVKVNATVADGVSDVRLEYQVVEPGAYVELADPAYAKGWVSVAMKLDGKVYVGEVPESVQGHRRLVRYRIAGRDSSGKGLVSPDVAGVEGASPNYGYFVYEGFRRGGVRFSRGAGTRDM